MRSYIVLTGTTTANTVLLWESICLRRYQPASADRMQQANAADKEQSGCLVVDERGALGYELNVVAADDELVLDSRAPLHLHACDQARTHASMSAMNGPLHSSFRGLQCPAQAGPAVDESLSQAAAAANMHVVWAAAVVISPRPGQPAEP